MNKTIQAWKGTKDEWKIKPYLEMLEEQAKADKAWAEACEFAAMDERKKNEILMDGYRDYVANKRKKRVKVVNWGE